jgi:hypothetical protein
MYLKMYSFGAPGPSVSGRRRDDDSSGDCRVLPESMERLEPQRIDSCFVPSSFGQSNKSSFRAADVAEPSPQ